MGQDNDGAPLGRQGEIKKEKRAPFVKTRSSVAAGGNSFEAVQSESPCLLISIKMLCDFYEAHFRTSDPQKTCIQGFKPTDKRQFN